MDPAGRSEVGDGPYLHFSDLQLLHQPDQNSAEIRPLQLYLSIETLRNAFHIEGAQQEIIDIEELTKLRRTRAEALGRVDELTLELEETKAQLADTEAQLAEMDEGAINAAELADQVAEKLSDRGQRIQRKPVQKDKKAAA